jgi:hypothetical protein
MLLVRTALRFSYLRLPTGAYLLLYTSVLRYFRPESAISVTTLASGPSLAATWIAATTFAPEDVPAKRASYRAIRLAMSFASSVLTGRISSTTVGSQSGGA